MPICEYCGRLHYVQVPDYRFCSTHCRQQQEQFLAAAGYTPDGHPTYLDYALTQADYLAHHLVSLAQRAAQLVQEAENDEDDEEVLRKKDALLEDLARGNSVAEEINRLTSLSPLMRSPTLGKLR